MVIVSQRLARRMSVFLDGATLEAAETVCESDLATLKSVLEMAIPRVVVSESIAPGDTRILARGNWMDESGELVQPAIPAFLGKLDTEGQV